MHRASRLGLLLVAATAAGCIYSRLKISTGDAGAAGDTKSGDGAVAGAAGGGGAETSSADSIADGRQSSDGATATDVPGSPLDSGANLGTGGVGGGGDSGPDASGGRPDVPVDSAGGSGVGGSGGGSGGDAAVADASGAQPDVPIGGAGGSATGGARPTGGTSTGGTSATGGIEPTGGTTSSTGTTNTGGTTSAGGTTATGGASTGGTSGTRPITVWMVGDSTMQNCSGGDQCGWAAEFQQYCGANATVSNQATGGGSIQTWIWGDLNVSKTATDANGECQVIDKTTYSDNWTTMLDPTKGMQPGDWVYVAFGINDSTGTCNRHVGFALFESDLAYLATTIRSKGANPIFGTPTSGQSCSGSTNVPNRAFGPETKAAGLANNVPVIDLTTLSVALYNSLNLCPGGGSNFWFDGTHFKTDGATQVAGVVAKAIKDQGIGLAAYLK